MFHYNSCFTVFSSIKDYFEKGKKKKKYSQLSFKLCINAVIHREIEVQMLLSLNMDKWHIMEDLSDSYYETGTFKATVAFVVYVYILW